MEETRSPSENVRDFDDHAKCTNCNQESGFSVSTRSKKLRVPTTAKPICLRQAFPARGLLQTFHRQLVGVGWARDALTNRLRMARRRA